MCLRKIVMIDTIKLTCDIEKLPSQIRFTENQKGVIKSIFNPTKEQESTGKYFPVGSNTESLLKATVVELESMNNCGYDVIGVNCGNILYANGADMLRAAFDHEYNRDVLLHEKSVAGTAQGWKSIAGYASAGNTSGGES